MAALLQVEDKEFTVETRGVSPAHLLIKIEKFSALLNHGIQKYESKEFEAGDYKWRLILHSDGDESANKGNYISVYLSIVETSSLPMEWEVCAIFNIFLYNQIQDNYLCFRGNLRRFHAMKSEWGYSKLIPKEMLTNSSNGYLVNDNCVLGAEVFVFQSQRAIECVSLLKFGNTIKRTWAISLFSKLKDIWTSEEFTVGDHRWRIKLYPNGCGSGKGHHISIFMECMDAKSFGPHQKLKTDICFRMKNKLSDGHHSGDLSHCFTSSEADWGWAQFMLNADMRDPSKGFVVDDSCLLETEMSVHVDASKCSK